MTSEQRQFARYLRVMHACEKGATGVYYGHRLVAWVLFRDIVPALNEMHAHEVRHYELFGQLIDQHKSRKVVAPVLWCAGGIVYGVCTALFGRRAIWKSTAIIETIVEKELTEAAAFFKERDRGIYDVIEDVLREEREHRDHGVSNSGAATQADAVIEPLAKGGAALSKGLAEKL